MADARLLIRFTISTLKAAICANGFIHLLAAILVFALGRGKEFCMNIYIGNLSYGTTEEALKAMFDEFGEVENVKIIKDRRSGRSKGFGFLEMPSNSEADQAIKALNGSRLDGFTIKVNPADPGGKKKPKRQSRRRNY